MCPSEPQHLYCWTITVVNAIPPSSVGSYEILAMIYSKDALIPQWCRAVHKRVLFQA